MQANGLELNVVHVVADSLDIRRTQKAQWQRELFVASRPEDADTSDILATQHEAKSEAMCQPTPTERAVRLTDSLSTKTSRRVSL
jgi:hypothetical protein